MMDIGTILVMGIVLAANLGVIKYKFERSRTADATLDLAMLIALAYVFGGSLSGLIIANVASAAFSIYLFFSPPRMDWMNEL